MNATPPMFEFLENTVRIFTFAVAMVFGTVESYIDTYYTQLKDNVRIENTQTVNLTLGCDATCSSVDIDIVVQRLNKLNAHPHILQQSASLIVMQVQVPVVEQSMLSSIFSKGGFRIVALQKDDSWLRTFVQTNPPTAGVVFDESDNSNRLVIRAESRHALRVYADLIAETQYEPLIECKIDGNVDKICQLHILDSQNNMSSTDIVETKTNFYPDRNNPLIGIQFSKAASERFEELTKKNVGHPLAILVGGQLISMPIVGEPIVAGNLSFYMRKVPAIFESHEKNWFAKIFSVVLEFGALRNSWKIESLTPILSTETAQN